MKRTLIALAAELAFIERGSTCTKENTALVSPEPIPFTIRPNEIYTTHIPFQPSALYDYKRIKRAKKR